MAERKKGSVFGATKPPERRPAAAPSAPRKVRATRDGLYDHIYRRAGDVFVIQDPATEFADAALDGGWMEYVSARTPTNVTTPQQALAREHEELRGSATSIERDNLGPDAGEGVLGEDE
jgi:hypothetical protein